MAGTTNFYGAESVSKKTNDIGALGNLKIVGTKFAKGLRDIAYEIIRKAMTAAFNVSIDGVTYPCIACTGFGMETGYSQVNVGGQQYPEFVQDYTIFSNLVITRVVDGTEFFANWYREVVANYDNIADNKKKHILIEAKNRMNGTIRRWTIVNARPCKWASPAFTISAEGKDYATETMEFCYDGIIDDIQSLRAVLAGSLLGMVDKAATAITKGAAAGVTKTFDETVTAYEKIPARIANNISEVTVNETTKPANAAADSGFGSSVINQEAAKKAKKERGDREDTSDLKGDSIQKVQRVDANGNVI